MSETLRDLCAEAINVDGTGDAVFYGALRGHRTFSEAYDGALPLSGVRIKIEEADEEGRIVRWEDSECTVTETGFSRDTCIHSSNSNDFVEFGPGYKRAFVFIPVDAIGSGGGGGPITTDDITDMTLAGKELATAVDKAAQRTELEVLSIDEISALQVVSYLDQGLIDETAQTQARTNIGAAGLNEVVRHDISPQGLDNDAKNRARVNIDVPSNAALSAEVTVRSEQFNALDAYVVALEASLGDAAYLDVGTTAGTVAAGDDSRFNRAATITTLRTSGTITVPSWAVTYKCEIWGQGGASGSGRKGATGTIACGGGSGSSGAYACITGAAEDLGGSVVCVVPAAPAGGAAVTTDDTNGNPGAARTNTSAQLGGFLFVVQGGAPGAGGTNAGASAGGVVAALSLPALSVAGTVGAAASGSGSTGASGGNTNFGNGSGGAGGGITAANAASSGGAGGNSVMFGTTFTGGSGGGAGVAGTAGTVATGFHGSGGGGGGGAALTGAAGAGANGVGYGGGSGGGGAARNGVGNSSGKGGDGTAGTVRITFYP